MTDTDGARTGAAEAPRVLVVEDDIATVELLAAALGRRGFAVDAVSSGTSALARLGAKRPDVVLADLNLGGGMNGLQLCTEVGRLESSLPVVVMTAFGSTDAAVEAVHAGAYDFITKPFDIDVVAVVLERAVRHGELVREIERLQKVAAESLDGTLLGTSDAMRYVKELVARLADSEVTVLVTGESGTGKELVARALHSMSRRASGPFVAINCAALPEALLESELFGHEKGAFTDARAARTGLFVLANGGTLFLDEVGELPATVQAKLLRALEERKVRPIGAEVEVPFDARIVAATNRDLDLAVAEGRFREDLYYRLAVVEIPMPPLRARGDDVLVLAQHVLARIAERAGKRLAGFTLDAAARLAAYRWPGNVRELANTMEHAVALAGGPRVDVDDLPERVRRADTDHAPSPGLIAPGELVPLEEIEHRYVVTVLDAVGGRRGRAAAILGIDRKTLYRKLERWGVSGDGGDG